MILHFLLDEKITDQVIANFESVSKKNKFLVFSKTQKPLKHIKTENQNIFVYDFEEQDINEVLNKIKPNGIILHAYHLEFAKTLLNIKHNVKVAWVAWGFDIYGLPKIKPLTYAPLTDSFLRSTSFFLETKRMILANDLYRKIFFFLLRKEDRYTLIFKSLDKVDYFTTYLAEDYSYFSKYYPNDMDFIKCTFTSIDQYLGGNKDISITSVASNILIGNSNTPESNHLDVMIKLKNLQQDSMSVFVPLSYGENRKYKSTVLEKGKSLFGKNFRPLLDFMEKGEYLKILRTCATGIFYHYRQQAMGNIIAMLFMGARIYMYGDSPGYKYLVRHQVAVYDFDRDYVRYKNNPLPQKLAEKNRKVLEELFSDTKVKDQLKNLINLMILKNNLD
ncbi:TDP-N-acetylfucosamine:lipid II N-acetylfucosaminyltransferase [Flagellimonas abyssi]|uniref:TDP-N-acetylfucosamine:lipid II N-acetylfucosaminyltransferase n=1 Tax=Flagellimonas abyssi TaxID=2864871 RepID=A0ABS7EN48_9FLAO|nr:TDP-N-acetylfucosamine:lipid II N-acetylfucosaminyltransferase [Allomuricauda abyssi]MBW8198971.1 TDP-N-acetylfucosamine:lipid II N-acetylfucosaminyltransferase [Allomuricauda abyssi]